MGSVMHPVGDQPVWVYWARRGAIVAAALVVLWLVFAMFQPAPSAPVAAVPATPTAPPTTPEVMPTVSESPTESASATPTGPLACDATNSDTSVAGYQKVKQDGKQLFKVAVANKGTADCVLDLKADTFNFVVSSGSDKIWTTEHCAKWVPTKKTTLKPKKAYEFTVEWSLKRSAANCRTTKDLVKPGTYVGTGTLADALSGRQVFVVSKA